jgi:hypothetical protein
MMLKADNTIQCLTAIDNYMSPIKWGLSIERHPVTIAHSIQFEIDMNVRPLSPHEHAALLKQDAPKRYRHFVSAIAMAQKVWGLQNEHGWVDCEDEHGISGVPFWPHPDYARECASDTWEGATVAEIDTNKFINEWLPKIGAAGVQVAVFPTPMMKGCFVPATKLWQDLLRELSKADLLEH